MSATAASVPGVDLDVEALMRLRGLVAKAGARRLFATAPPLENQQRRRRGRGAETYDVRPWSDGDDIRQLDRNVTARTGAPHVRTFHEERESSVLYLVDLRPSMFFGTRRAFRSAAAVEAAVLSAWRTLDARGRAGLSVVTSSGSRFLGWATNERSFAPLLFDLVETYGAALANAGAAEAPLAEALELVGERAASGALTIVSGMDTPGERFDAVCERLARPRQFTVLLIADRFERAAPPGDYPFRTREGVAGRLRIAKDHRPTSTIDDRQLRLRRLGARVLRLDAGDDAIATARALESFDGRFV